MAGIWLTAIEFPALWHLLIAVVAMLTLFLLAAPGIPRRLREHESQRDCARPGRYKTSALTRGSLAVERDKLREERRSSLHTHHAESVPLDLFKDEQDGITRRLAFLDSRIDVVDADPGEPFDTLLDPSLNAAALTYGARLRAGTRRKAR